MRLQYKILWLDDKIAEFTDDEIIEEIKKFLFSYGFIPEIDACDNPNDFFKLLDDSYDLILTDYHMNDMDGDRVVEKIRGSEYEILTEILFYTAKADLADVSKIDRVSFLETGGVTKDHVDAILNKVKELIYLTIRKAQDLNNLRGLVMAETSELDSLMKQILALTALKSKVSEKRISEKYEKMLKKSKEKSSEIESYTIPTDFIKLTKTHHFTSGISYDFLYHFSKDKSNDMDPIILLPYIKQVIEERNNLAHNPEDSSTPDKMIIIKKGKPLEYDENKFIEIRKDIQKYKQIFQEIINSLK